MIIEFDTPEGKAAINSEKIVAIYEVKISEKSFIPKETKCIVCTRKETLYSINDFATLLGKWKTLQRNY